MLAATMIMSGRLWSRKCAEFLYTHEHSQTAGAIMLNTLNTTRTGLAGPRSVFRRLCTKVEPQPMIMVSGSDSSTTPSSVNRKLTDMEALVPGRET